LRGLSWFCLESRLGSAGGSEEGTQVMRLPFRAHQAWGYQKLSFYEVSAHRFRLTIALPSPAIFVMTGIKVPSSQFSDKEAYLRREIHYWWQFN